MTVESSDLTPRRIFTCTSADDKPDSTSNPRPSHNDLLWEADTGVAYIWRDGAWAEDTRRVYVYVVAGAHIDAANGVAVVEQGQFDYEPVAASQTDQVLGDTGGVGDFLHKLVCVVDTVGAGGAASVKDGSGSDIPIVPASAPIGVHVVELNIVSKDGAWKVTTGANVAVLGIGRFTA
ncbi:MAG: hypothetical protein H6948_02240 [Zoogloeaceae bacterium]|nr:hypothetical protein [Zoogloeaceae bacterium]